MSRGLQLFRRCVLATILLTISAGPARAQFKELVRRIPGTANTIVVLNVDKIHNSPRAILGGWKKNHEKAFEAGLMIIPPEASRFVLASQIDFELMKPTWSIAVLDLNNEASMTLVARRHKSAVDTVAGLQAVALPSDAYVVQFGPRTVGAMSPANRQSVARWVRQAQSNTSIALSPYLQEAVGYADNVGTEIIMALDMADVLPQDVVRGKLKSLEMLAGREVDLDRLSAIICSVKGVTLGIRIGEKPFGKIKVDFGQDASMAADFAKPLLLQALANQGAKIDDFDKWKAVVRGKQVSIEGYFTSSGLRRVLSVIDAPKTSFGASKKQGEFQSPGETISKADASKGYFHRVTTLVGDLQRHSKDAKTIGQIGLWLGKYAGKINRLSVLNVDDELLDYGEYVAEQLRNAASAVKGIGIRSGARQAQIYGGGAYGAYGGQSNTAWSSGRWREFGTVSARRAVRAEEKATGATSARGIMQEVQNATAKIRRKMAQRYQIEF